MEHKYHYAWITDPVILIDTKLLISIAFVLAFIQCGFSLIFTAK